jgi:hypothetical protein
MPRAIRNTSFAAPPLSIDSTARGIASASVCSDVHVLGWIGRNSVDDVRNEKRERVDEWRDDDAGRDAGEHGRQCGKGGKAPALPPIPSLLVLEVNPSTGPGIGVWGAAVMVTRVPALTVAALGATRRRGRRSALRFPNLIADEREPVVPVGHAAVDDVEEASLDLLGDRSSAGRARW